NADRAAARGAQRERYRSAQGGDRAAAAAPMTVLIFDCDGVLVDSEVLALETLRDMMAALGRPMTMEEADREFTGGSLAATLATAERLLGRPVPADVGAEFGRLLFERFRRDLKPMPGVREAILALPYPRCVASSSSPDRLTLSLEVTGLAPLFEHVFSAVQVARGKPAPDLHLLAARTMGQPPEHSIVIE